MVPTFIGLVFGRWISAHMASMLSDILSTLVYAYFELMYMHTPPPFRFLSFRRIVYPSMSTSASHTVLSSQVSVIDITVALYVDL